MISKQGLSKRGDLNRTSETDAQMCKEQDLANIDAASAAPLAPLLSAAAAEWATDGGDDEHSDCWASPQNTHGQHWLRVDSLAYTEMRQY